MRPRPRLGADPGKTATRPRARREPRVRGVTADDYTVAHDNITGIEANASRATQVGKEPKDP